jgi:hypothetical protein
MNPKSPQPNGFTKLQDRNQILLKIRLIPLGISGAYPPVSQEVMPLAFWKVDCLQFMGI